MGQSVQTIQAGNQGITTMSKLLDSAKAASSQALALASTDTTGRSKLAQQVKDLFTQMQQAAKDSSYNGRNLLSGSANDMKVQFNEDSSSSLTVKGVDFSGIDVTKSNGTGTTALTYTTVSTYTATGANAANTYATNSKAGAANSLTVNVDGKGAVDISSKVTATSTKDDILGAINAEIAAKTGNTSTTASFDKDGKLTVSGPAKVTVAGTSPTTTTFGATSTATVNTYTAPVGTYDKVGATSTTGFTASANSSANDLTVKIGGAAAVNVSINSGENAAAILGKINTALGSAGTASFDGSGKIVLKGASNNIVITGNATGTGGDYSKFSVDNTASTQSAAPSGDANNLTLKIGSGAAVDVAIGSGKSATDIAAALQTQLRLTASEANATVSVDANGKLSIAGASQQIVIAGADHSAAGGLNLAAFSANTTATGTSSASGAALANFTVDSSSATATTSKTLNSTADMTFASDAEINAVMDNLNNIQKMLRSQASQLGTNLSTVQIRQDFTKNIINTLQVGADKLTLADTNEEGANMLALQTQQQLASKSLSLASQADQSVLRLLG